jgi:hypothetical protein
MNDEASKIIGNGCWMGGGKKRETHISGGGIAGTLIPMIQLVLTSANRLISNILSLDAKPCAWLHCFGKKDHGFFVFFVFFVVMGRLPKWPRPLGTKLAITTDNP